MPNKDQARPLRLNQEEIFDIVGIGVGPFNLGLAALVEPLVRDGELSAAFLDGREGFRWHPGVMFDDATIQVPFIADLVTFADPASKFSFLNYLKCTNRLYRFYIRESFYPFRREYSEYCSWVAHQLDFVHWSSEVQTVHRAENGLWEIYLNRNDCPKIYAKRIINGTGTNPFIPEELNAGNNKNDNIFHSSEFLFHTDSLSKARSITIIGSGQSAAEIYRHLMDQCSCRHIELNWYTRSPRFFPMEYTALTLEMTSPEYARYFRHLPETTRDQLNREQRSLYKGISGNLVDEIYDKLYQLNLSDGLSGEIQAGVEARLATPAHASEGHVLVLTDSNTGREKRRETDVIILATGYAHPKVPPHLSEIDEINLDESGRMRVSETFSITDKNDLFILNAEEHLHSLIAPDLGMGPWRNSIIINTICGRDVYPVEETIAFQSFGE